MFLFLDESGDLGFDFTKQGTSRYFVIGVAQFFDCKTVKTSASALKQTIHRKINQTKKNQKVIELKGTETDLKVKNYLFSKLNKHLNWQIHFAVLDKHNFPYHRHTQTVHQVYDYVTAELLKNIYKKNEFTELHVDKSKTENQIRAFNQRMRREINQLTGCTTLIKIAHESSHHEKLLQIVDLFTHGVFRKYEHNDCRWYDIFKERIKIEKLV